MATKLHLVTAVLYQERMGLTTREAKRTRMMHFKHMIRCLYLDLVPEYSMHNGDVLILDCGCGKWGIACLSIRIRNLNPRMQFPLAQIMWVISICTDSVAEVLLAIEM